LSCHWPQIGKEQVAKATVQLQELHLIIKGGECVVLQRQICRRVIMVWVKRDNGWTFLLISAWSLVLGTWDTWTWASAVSIDCFLLSLNTGSGRQSIIVKVIIARFISVFIGFVIGDNGATKMMGTRGFIPSHKTGKHRVSRGTLQSNRLLEIHNVLLKKESEIENSLKRPLFRDGQLHARNTGGHCRQRKHDCTCREMMHAPPWAALATMFMPTRAIPLREQAQNQHE
jgi:hypothetical protein